MILDRLNHYLNRLNLGFRIETTPDYLVRRKKLISSLKIDLILDVGANRGLFASEMRKLGFKDEIVSFEPLPKPFEQMQALFQSDPKWRGFNFGLGNENGEQLIHVANNSVSSSLLPMMQAHRDAEPAVKFVNQEKVSIKTLDDIIPSLGIDLKRNVLLKIDTQGFENRVLEGGSISLKKINTLLVEMSLIPLYEDEMTFIPLCAKLELQGFRILSIEPGFQNHENGQLLQVDVILHRSIT